MRKALGVWGDTDPWDRGGDEWSDPFGGTDRLWDVVLKPRIGHLLGGRTVEIAPGYGRMTEKLLPHVDHLIAVDLNQNCIDACAEGSPTSRTSSFTRTTAGRSRWSPTRRPTSSCASTRSSTRTPTSWSRTSTRSRYLNPLRSVLGDRAATLVNKRANRNWRGSDVSATGLRAHANRLGLKINVAERVNWHSRMLNDCFSLISWSGEETTLRNWRFFQGAAVTAAYQRAAA